MGLFVRPLALARQPSWAEVQWLVSPGTHIHTSENDFGVRLNLVRCRGTYGGKSISISINTVTGSVQIARSDREQIQSIGKPASAIPPQRSHRQPMRSQTDSVSVATRVAHPALGRSGT